jgi:Flp pilus assembly protein TadB
LALAWTQIYVADKAAYRELVLLVISVVGMAMGFQWALLGARMWQYHLEFIKRLTRLWDKFTEETEGPGATAWKEVDAAIAEHWRDNKLFKWLTGNQWILFTSPLLLSLVHLAMLAVVVWGVNLWGHYIAIAAVILGLIAFAWAWKTCEPILKK